MSAKDPPTINGRRCCGNCHPAVGGCLYGVVFDTPEHCKGMLAGRHYRTPEGREVGTPPMVELRSGRWGREDAKESE